jgi:hypothetical protein
MFLLPRTPPSDWDPVLAVSYIYLLRFSYVFNVSSVLPRRPPSDWDPALAVRSGRLPEEALQLEWVYGYDV